MNPNFNANLFELKVHEPLEVSTYLAELEPSPEKPTHFYQVLGRLARILTESTATAVISDEGKIKILESTISEDKLVNEIELENIAKFKVKLRLEESGRVNFADSPLAYGRIVSKIVDLALCHLSKDYYKYSEMSPYILERGEGYFDKALRQRIGVEDGRRFYRGLRIAFGAPYLIINREIELRSWKSLLNELKILAEWWQKTKKKEEKVDFYNPPKEFISFANWAFRNRTANVIAYSAPSIVIREITWDARARSKVLQGNISPCEYHKKAQGIILKDEDQPLIKWTMIDKTGASRDQFHVPELLVVGHTFRDIRMRVMDSQVSQVFDTLHPHCGDQQRKIFDLVRKIDCILRNNFKTVYPSKLEFTVFPMDVSKAVVPPSTVTIKFGNREVELSPPYGINFYRKYTSKDKFVKPLIGKKRVMAICEEKHRSFIEDLAKEIELRNNCRLLVSYGQQSELDTMDPSDYDMVFTITNDADLIRSCKDTLIGKLGIAHQNVTPEKANIESIPQLAMQTTLKLGGYPWFIANPEQVKVLSIYTYRNPFNGLRCYVFSLMTPEGELLYQSKPFEIENFRNLLDEMRTIIAKKDRLLVIMSFSDEQIEDSIEEVVKDVAEFIFVRILQNNELRIFSTFRPTIVSAPRRRTSIVTYPCEAYENAPQGAILSTGEGEYYILTTGSTKVGTYHRGCPTPIRIRILATKGNFDIIKILHHILSLALAAGTSGHGTRLPSSLYYLKKYARYVNEYGLPTQREVQKRIFYV